MVALFVALMFIGFILLDLALQKVEARRAARGLTLAARTIAPRRPASRPLTLDGWPVLPEGVYLSRAIAGCSPRGRGRFRLGRTPSSAKR